MSGTKSASSGKRQRPERVTLAFADSLLTALMLCTVLSLAGCLLLPVPMKRVEQNTAGIKAKLPNALPSVGVTTRLEVEKQYQQVEVDSGVPGLFWAQFERSTWGIIYGAAAQTGAVGGSSRSWHLYNLFVSFDEKQVARTVSLVRFNQLVSWSKSAQEQGILPRLDISKPIGVEATSWSGPVVKNVLLELSATSLNATIIKRGPWLHRSKIPPPRVATVPLTDIEKISIEDIDKKHKWEDEFKHCPFRITMRFAHPTAVGERLSLYLEPKDALTLIRWYNQQQTTR